MGPRHLATHSPTRTSGSSSPTWPGATAWGDRVTQACNPVRVHLLFVTAMPHKCCVPLCRGNYDTGPRVHTFGFPKEQQLFNTWLRAIRRDNFTPTSHHRVSNSCLSFTQFRGGCHNYSQRKELSILVVGNISRRNYFRVLL